MILAPGTRLGAYEILSLIGKDGNERGVPRGRLGRMQVHAIESGTDAVVVEHPKYSLTLPRLFDRRSLGR